MPDSRKLAGYGPLHRISARDLVRRPREILDRVQWGGERFLVLRHDRIAAVLAPAEEERRSPTALDPELVDKWRDNEKAVAVLRVLADGRVVGCPLSRAGFNERWLGGLLTTMEMDLLIQKCSGGYQIQEAGGRLLEAIVEESGS